VRPRCGILGRVPVATSPRPLVVALLAACLTFAPACGKKQVREVFEGAPHAIAADDAAVLVATWDKPSTTLTSIDRRSGARRAVATMPGAPLDVLRVGAATLVSTETGVHVVRDGRASLLVGDVHPWRLASDGRSVFFFDRKDRTSPGRLLRVELGGGAPRELARDVYARVLAVDDRRVWFIAERPGRHLHAIPKDGGPGAEVAPLGSASWTEGAVAVSGEWVYYCSDMLYRRRRADDAAPAEKLSQSCGDDIVAAKDVVYLRSGTQGVASIYGCATAVERGSCMLRLQTSLISSVAVAPDGAAFWAGLDGAKQENVVGAVPTSTTRL